MHYHRRIFNFPIWFPLDSCLPKFSYSVLFIFLFLSSPTTMRSNAVITQQYVFFAQSALLDEVILILYLVTFLPKTHGAFRRRLVFSDTAWRSPTWLCIGFSPYFLSIWIINLYFSLMNLFDAESDAIVSTSKLCTLVFGFSKRMF